MLFKSLFATLQANSKTCTLHPIANSVVEACMDIRVDLNLDQLVGAMKQLHFVDIEGNMVEDFNGAQVKKMTDMNSKNPLDIQIQISMPTEEEVLRRLQNKSIKCVLVYRDPSTAEPHCVYVDGLTVALEKERYICINSWGVANNDVFLREVNLDNTLFEVTVTVTESRSERSTFFAYFAQLPPPNLGHLHLDSAQSSESSPVWIPSSSSSPFPPSPGSPSWSEPDSWNMGEQEDVDDNCPSSFSGIYI